MGQGGDKNRRPRHITALFCCEALWDYAKNKEPSQSTHGHASSLGKLEWLFRKNHIFRIGLFIVQLAGHQIHAHKQLFTGS